MLDPINERSTNPIKENPTRAPLLSELEAGSIQLQTVQHIKEVRATFISSGFAAAFEIFAEQTRKGLDRGLSFCFVT